MHKLIMVSALATVSAASFAIPAFTQGGSSETAGGQRREARGGEAKRQAATSAGDVDKLYELVRQARADVAALRRAVGIRGESAEGGREGRGEHGEGGREGRGERGGGEHGEGREGRGEERGEHGAGGREGRGEGAEGGEEGGKRIAKRGRWNETRNGARLIIAYDAASQSFKGVVRNTTTKTLSDVRVEVHLSNGVELGPTKRADLKPGATMPVELSAAGQAFTWWTTHPEHGNEEGHGPGHEGGGEGAEGGETDGNRPSDPTLRPLYNQLQLLRREIETVKNVLANRRR